MSKGSNVQFAITKSIFDIVKALIASHSTKDDKIAKDVLMGTVNGCVSVIAMCLHMLKLRENELDSILKKMADDIKSQYKIFDAS